MCKSNRNTATTAAVIKESPAKPHEFVRLYLDIDQCRFIHALLSEKFKSDKAKGLPDKNNALEQMLDRFERHAYPSLSTPFHKDESFEIYLDSQDPQGINELLQELYVDGVLHVEQ